MTNDELDELMALHAAGTQGEWRHYMGDITADDDDLVIAGMNKSCGARSSEYRRLRAKDPAYSANGDLIAAAVNNLPALVAEVRALREERDRLRVSFANDVSRAAGVMVSLTTRHGHKTDAAYLAAMVDLMAREAAKLEAAISAALETPHE
jgi:hypothetical protein